MHLDLLDCWALHISCKIFSKLFWQIQFVMLSNLSSYLVITDDKQHLAKRQSATRITGYKCYALVSIITLDLQAQMATPFIEFSHFDHWFTAPPGVSHFIQSTKLLVNPSSGRSILKTTSTVTSHDDFLCCRSLFHLQYSEQPCP